MRKERSFASLATVFLGLSVMSVVSVTEARDRAGRSPPEPPHAAQVTDHALRPAPSEGGTGATSPALGASSEPGSRQYDGQADRPAIPPVNVPAVINTLDGIVLHH